MKRDILGVAPLKVEGQPLRDGGRYPFRELRVDFGVQSITPPLDFGKVGEITIASNIPQEAQRRFPLTKAQRIRLNQLRIAYRNLTDFRGLLIRVDEPDLFIQHQIVRALYCKNGKARK